MEDPATSAGQEVHLPDLFQHFQIRMNIYYVYILTNHGRTVFYTGFTDDLGRRMYEHKNKLFPGFTARYNCNILLYYEEYEDADEARHRENQVKRYKREWKRNLVDSINSEWNDLSDQFPFEP
ncbi:GIY-YIG nuclease family protein [Ekhidna sp.]